MTIRESSYFFILNVAAIGCMFFSESARAETPLSLAVSENLTYDSNILRNNDNKYRDLVSATGVQLGFAKQYGRQTYKASGTVVATRYKNSDFYNNDGYNLALGFSSQIASNWLVDIDHNRVRQLQSFQDQGLNRYKEPVESQDTKIFVQYGLYSRWSLNADVNQSKINYKVLRSNDRSSQGAKAGVRYSPTDLLYFDLGYRKTKSELPNYKVIRNSGGGQISEAVGEDVQRQDLEFSTRWTVTGYSSLDARLAWTQEHYDTDRLRNFNGITGRLGWNYTPSGKMSYTVAIDRDTNNSGGNTSLSYNIAPDLSGFTGNIGFNSQRRATTGLLVRATYGLTSKISVTATGVYRRIEEESESISTEINGGEVNSANNRGLNGSYRSVNIGVGYQLFRSTRVGCSWETYARSASLFSRDFSGDSVNCNAMFTID
ncbi:hypothetical protein EIP75_06310 [Aquabacterium soli]|uniref:Beta-barrel porin 2 n=1 Tax=Aquabacterium soli TaxID=2493092 RepID=A0A3R8S4C6_9BURK|nr:hypothetical protein [Aquabacterium soli]RRS05175.1 hypothetical protein EIP75_06310 [Aquabacterium soli]